MVIQKPMKVFYLNGLNAAANYPVLTYCPASGQQVSSWRGNLTVIFYIAI